MSKIPSGRMWVQWDVWRPVREDREILRRAAIRDSAARHAVTDGSGKEVKGQLRSLTSTTIEVMNRDGASRTFDRANVQRIVLRDSVGNGAQVGSLVGAVPMLVTGLLINAGCRNEGGDCLSIILGLTGLGAGIGAGLGAAVDSAIHEVVYDRKLGTPNTVTQGRGPRISMNVTPTRASLGMSYGW